MRKLLTFLIALDVSAGISVSSSAQVGQMPNIAQLQPGVSGVTYTGPGDIVTGWSFWYGLRAFTAAYATAHGNLADIVDTSSGSFSCTIVANSAGDADLTSLSCTGGTLSVTTFCTVTHSGGCSIKKLYDQTTNGFPATQATLASMPTLTFNVTNGKPVMTFAGGQLMSNSATFTGTFTQPYTTSIVARRTSNFSGQDGILATNGFGGANGFFVDFGTGASIIDLNAGGGDTSTPATDNVFNAVQAVANGTSSTVKINNGSLHTVSPGTAGVSSNSFIVGDDTFGNHLHGNIGEAGFNQTGISSGNQTSLDSQQQTYWGF